MIKRKLYKITELSCNKYSVSWYIDCFIILLILLNVVGIVLESVESIYTKYQELFYYFEIFSVVVFTIEYLVRIYSITESPEYKHFITGRLRYSISFYALIDLFAILPFYLSFIIPDLRFIRVLRLLRLIRLLKVIRFIKAIRVIEAVFRNTKDELFISFLIIAKVLFLSSTLMYFCEHTLQPDKFSSIPATMWWSTMTLTTVGYGDIYPITSLGKFFAGLISLLGIAVFALPTGILVGGFSEQIRFKKSKDR